ncbi:RNA polymerase sigma factor [Aquimarina sediminis]|uniref:RNA polymerase sigma factor n=1 Tax=Aquimarina sediminis TaxID=2070536 RepID=UPI000CA0282B|nr:RNA polymerase sigma-70 factor [Aquimarina sediminis]
MKKIYTDSELTLLLYQGEELAFDEIYKRYSGKMFSYALNVLKKRQICEDLVQNIFLDIWNKKTSREIENLSAFLFKAIKFQIFNHFRKNSLSKENLTRFNLIQDTIEINDTMEYTELETYIKKCIEELPDRCKYIFLLSRFENKSNKEIAKELGISVQGVKNQISKALKLIRAKLIERKFLLP